LLQLARRNRVGDAALGIEAEDGCDFLPWSAECRRGSVADQAGECVIAKREAVVFVHVPGEAQRVLWRCHGRVLHVGLLFERGVGGILLCAEALRMSSR
jgi:hypothetical protein